MNLSNSICVMAPEVRLQDGTQVSNKRKAHADQIENTYSVTHKQTKSTPTLCTTIDRLKLKFYDQPCINLAKALLGQTLVRVLADGERLAGKIVETESYLGTEDTAAHSYQGRKTERNLAMFMPPGTTYVYLIYGMYSCLNISSRGEGCCVLIRALEPLEGLETMTAHRSRRRKETSKPLKLKDLCSGPGKLTDALHINKKLLDTKDLITDTTMWIEPGDSVKDDHIIECPRIGIEGSASAEWLTKPLRFYIKGNSCVSKRDKAVERQ